MSKKRGNFLLLGALIGFIAGLFFAPKKGSELRKDAKNKIDEIKENPKDVLQGTFDDVKEKINDFIDDNFAEDDNIHISEEEIVISRTFVDEGENK
ncbi:MAG TPA: YtxH domain-containing protein [Romboutsia timonensis]|uniref:YtxH domain-containing protein n=1 Tax=Romboutsia timonensis TaxID=1776391 RepID=A0A921N382_9FIRM|nr:YtxH domain-containing protein [uncultured Romboutsia sp.]HJG97489.1 YtxH domain-containing protein [Romboutsia timonensis]